MSQLITNVIGGLYQPYASEVLTVSTTAIGLTASKYNTSDNNRPLLEAQYVIITSETADIRYTLDGVTAPVGGSTGHLLTSGSSMVLIGRAAISQFSAIRNAGADATLQVTYER